MNFEAEVRAKFDFLFSVEGFVIEKENSDNHLIFASGCGMKIRFIHDRADFFLDFYCPNAPGKWVEFYAILEKLNEKGLIVKDYKASNKISNHRSFLKKYFSIIKENKDCWNS